MTRWKPRWLRIPMFEQTAVDVDLCTICSCGVPRRRLGRRRWQGCRDPPKEALAQPGPQAGQKWLTPQRGPMQTWPRVTWESSWHFCSPGSCPTVPAGAVLPVELGGARLYPWPRHPGSEVLRPAGKMSGDGSEESLGWLLLDDTGY